MATGTRRIKRNPNQLVSLFRQWRQIKDDGEALGERQEELRLRLLDTVISDGEKDSQGHTWLDFQEPISFTDHKGNLIKYSGLKRERHLSPAKPVPDRSKAEKYLRRRGWWLTPEQEKVLDQLRLVCPFVSFSVEPNADVIATANVQGRISENVYASLLVDQKSRFSSVPVNHER